MTKPFLLLEFDHRHQVLLLAHTICMRLLLSWASMSGGKDKSIIDSKAQHVSHYA
jgi:hypothetical protein